MVNIWGHVFEVTRACIGFDEVKVDRLLYRVQELVVLHQEVGPDSDFFRCVFRKHFAGFIEDVLGNAVSTETELGDSLVLFVVLVMDARLSVLLMIF